MDSHQELSALKAEIAGTQTRILQDYFRMSLEEGNGHSSWVTRYETILEDGVRGSHPSQYQGAKKAFDKKGVGTFDERDMDISIICTMFEHHRDDLELGKPGQTIYADVLRYMRCIRDDRNDLYAHDSFSDDGFAVLSAILVRLEHAMRFISAAKRDWSIDRTEGSAYFHRWNVGLREFEKRLSAKFAESESERELAEEIRTDIQRMLGSRDVQGSYFDLYKKYMNLHQDGEEGHVRPLLDFQRSAAKAGISNACIFMGDYYSGKLWPMRELAGQEADYSLAASYYLMARDDLQPDDKAQLASIMLNGLCEGYGADDGETLLAQCPRRWGSRVLHSYEMDGMTFYAYGT